MWGPAPARASLTRTALGRECIRHTGPAAQLTDDAHLLAGGGRAIRVSHRGQSIMTGPLVAGPPLGLGRWRTGPRASRLTPGSSSERCATQQSSCSPRIGRKRDVRKTDMVQMTARCRFQTWWKILRDSRVCRYAVMIPAVSSATRKSCEFVAAAIAVLSDTSPFLTSPKRL